MSNPFALTSEVRQNFSDVQQNPVITAKPSEVSTPTDWPPAAFYTGRMMSKLE